MKREKWAAAVLAAACVALAVWGPNSSGGGDLIYGLALPFIGLGAGLRGLSLWGFFGNVLAVVFYAALSLLPLGVHWYGMKRKGKGVSWWLPAAMSGYLFFLLYYFANPSMIQTLFHPAGSGSSQALYVEQSMLCMFLYSLLIAWWILALLRDTGRIAHKLKLLVRVAGAMLIVSICYVGAARLKSALLALPWPGADQLPPSLMLTIPGISASDPTLDALMAWLQFAFDSAPTVVLFTVLPAADKLIGGMERSFFSEENQLCAAAIASRCKAAIFVSLGGMLAFNGLQLILARNLANVNISGQLPIATLLLSLAMLFLSRYLEKSCEVYRENQLMI